jgi:ketosteroid isomerase-like protein
MGTKEVIEHHLGAFGSGDVDEMLKDYTESSVLMTPDGELKGLDSLRGAFADMLGGIFKPGTYEFTMDRMAVEGDVGFVKWHATTSAGEIPVGTDTFVIRDGKIAVQSFVMHLHPA